MRVRMDRRSVLKGGAAACAVAGSELETLARAAVASAGVRPIAERLQRGMIWVRDARPVLVGVQGGLGISGNAGGPPKPPDAVGGSAGTPALTDLHAVFWKEFAIAGGHVAAEMHVFAYTRYRLYVNGRYVGRGPSRFQNQRPEFDTWDVASYLGPGNNRVAVLVHRDAPTGRIMSHAPGFTAVVEWVDGRGLKGSVGTDESWRSAAEMSFGTRKVAWASIPENIDARRMADWTGADFSGEGWAAAVRVADAAGFFPLWPRTTPLQRETERTLTAVGGVGGGASGGEIKAGEEMMLAAEQLMQAYHVLEFQADPGSSMDVDYLLPERENSGRSSYVARGGVETWMGGDTFAFTTLRIRVKTGRVALGKARAFEVGYPFTRVGGFTSSDAMLNRLWRICARTLEVVSEDAYVDCADRERVEWTDCTPPAYECTRVMMAGPGAGGAATAWSDGRLVKAMVERIGLTQRADGQIKAHSCSERWDIHAIMEDRSCDWVNAARQYYDSTGDKAFIRRIWPAMVRLMDWFLGRRTVRGLVEGREWEVWDNPLRYQVCEGAGLNAMVYGALRDAAYLGAETGVAAGRGADAARMGMAADRVREAFQTQLWDEGVGSYSGGYFGPGTKLDPEHNREIVGEKIVEGRFRATLQAAVFALACGIVAETRRARVEEFVLTHEAEATDTMSHFYMYGAMYGMDRAELDVRVLESMRRKWRPQVESVWGTSWESLKGNSKVHCYGMLPGYFLSAYVLGVRRDGPVGKRRILIEPRCGDLTRAEGVVVTEHGPVPVGWTCAGDGRVAVRFTVPEGARATVRLRAVGDGRRLLVDGVAVAGAVVARRVVVEVGAGAHTVEQTA